MKFCASIVSIIYRFQSLLVVVSFILYILVFKGFFPRAPCIFFANNTLAQYMLNSVQYVSSNIGWTVLWLLTILQRQILQALTFDHNGLLPRFLIRRYFFNVGFDPVQLLHWHLTNYYIIILVTCPKSVSVSSLRFWVFYSHSRQLCNRIFALLLKGTYNCKGYIVYCLVF